MSDTNHHDETACRRLAAGLPRGVSGLKFAEIAAPLRCSYGAAHRSAQARVEALRAERAHAAAAGIVHSVVRREFGAPRRPFDLPRRVRSAGVEVEDAQRGFVGSASAGRG